MRNNNMAENKKERFEILLEAIQGDVKAIAEGQGLLSDKVNSLDSKVNQLDRKIDAVHDSLKSEIATTAKVLDFSIKELGTSLNGKIDRVEMKLDAHIKQPAHA